MILKVFDNIVVNYDDYHKYKKTVSKSFKRKIIDSLMGDCFDELKPKVTCLLNPATFRSNKTPTYDNKVVIAVGRLDYIKGFDLLIDSWSAIAPDYPGWKLRIVGGGERAQDLINQIDQLSLNNVVEMIPSSDDVKSLLLSSSIYAMSSREEGLPMAVIEAMECGLPVVAFNNIGASYLVKDKENGLVCDIGNTEALSSNMEALMNDKEMRQEMGCKSKEMAQQFHIENIFPIWNDLLS
jgi:glycosyltransferase involved in cell wall biosynthesis